MSREHASGNVRQTSSQRVSARQLREIKNSLSKRDLAILSQILELRFMSAKQIQGIHFSGGHATDLAAARASRRTLQRLHDHRLLIRLQRRIGGLRAGSASYVYSIGPVGQRVLEPSVKRRRFREPSQTFLAHTLAISEAVAQLHQAEQTNQVELLDLRPEPDCWRRTINAGGGITILRPDLFITIGSRDGYEYRWFVEVDLGTEHLPTLLKKCLAYQSYYQSGQEQARHGIFPRVLWLMHQKPRVARLSEAIASDQHLTRELFMVTTADQFIRVASGGQP